MKMSNETCYETHNLIVFKIVKLVEISMPVLNHQYIPKNYSTNLLIDVM